VCVCVLLPLQVGWEWWSKELVPNVISQDYSWNSSAQQYLDIYAKLSGVQVRPA
jgi:glycogen synthase